MKSIKISCNPVVEPMVKWEHSYTLPEFLMIGKQNNRDYLWFSDLHNCPVGVLFCLDEISCNYFNKNFCVDDPYLRKDLFYKQFILPKYIACSIGVIHNDTIESVTFICDYVKIECKLIHLDDTSHFNRNKDCLDYILGQNGKNLNFIPKEERYKYRDVWVFSDSPFLNDFEAFKPFFVYIKYKMEIPEYSDNKEFSNILFLSLQIPIVVRDKISKIESDNNYITKCGITPNANYILSNSGSISIYEVMNEHILNNFHKKVTEKCNIITKSL